MADDFKLPKHQVPAQLTLSGGRVHQVQLFLGEAAAGHTGAERLSDLLGGAESFFPAIEEGGAFRLVNRANVVFARVAESVEHAQLDELIPPSQHEVRVMLRDGAVLQGKVVFVQRVEHSRLIDFLNEAPAFFALHEEDQVTLVNKSYVAEVEILKE